MPRVHDLTPPAARRRGATLLGSLSGMLLLSVLALLALPLCLGAEADKQKKTCRANMQTIANAVQAAYVKSGAPDPRMGAPDFSPFTGPVDPALEEDLQTVPICPGGGHYTVVAGPGKTNDGRTIPAGSFAIQCDYRPGRRTPSSGNGKNPSKGKPGSQNPGHGSYIPGDK